MFIPVSCVQVAEQVRCHSGLPLRPARHWPSHLRGRGRGRGRGRPVERLTAALEAAHVATRPGADEHEHSFLWLSYADYVITECYVTCECYVPHEYD